MKFRRGIFGLALTGALALAAFPADAADLSAGGYKDTPAPAVTLWSGFYAGINGGAGWSQVDNLSYAAGNLGGVNPSGGFGGGQLGYNWQGGQGYGRYTGYGSLVLGVEADLQGAGFQDSATNGSGDRSKSELDYFGTVRGRIGFATDRTLYYATGGLAYGGLQNDATIGKANFSTSNTPVGYVLGGGIELKTGAAWSVKLEYQYINLGTNDPANATFGSYSANGGRVNDDEFHTFRAGLNYHVGPSYEPLK
jgi:outer membrane immunogenic protein